MQLPSEAGLISFNVSNSAGKDMEFNINLIKAYDETTDGKYVLVTTTIIL